MTTGRQPFPGAPLPSFLPAGLPAPPAFLPSFLPVCLRSKQTGTQTAQTRSYEKEAAQPRNIHETGDREERTTSSITKKKKDGQKGEEKKRRDGGKREANTT